MSKTDLGAGNTGIPAKKSKTDTENLDLGSEAPVDRIEVVLPGNEGFHQKNVEIATGSSEKDVNSDVSTDGSNDNQNADDSVFNPGDVDFDKDLASGDNDANSDIAESENSNGEFSQAGQSQIQDTPDARATAGGSNNDNDSEAPSLTQEQSNSSSDGTTGGSLSDGGDVAVNNSAPTDISVSNTNIDENSAAGTVVATLSATDSDAGESFSYTLVSDTSDNFEIVGNEIRVKAGADLDFENALSHEITIQVTDSSGNTYSETVVIDVSDINEFSASAISDTDTDGAGNSVNENAGGGATVGVTAFATDADGSDNITYTLSDDAGGLFAIDGTTGVVTTTGDLDAETAASYDIEVTATSDDTSSTTQSYTITVNDQDEFDVSAVIDSDDTANTLAENASAGDTVGVVASASDADATNNTVTYAVDDARFEVAADGTVTVATDANFDAETEATVDIVVTATAFDGSTSDETFTLTVANIIDEVPTDITFTGGTVNETITDGGDIGSANDPSGTTVATLSTTDADSGDSFTYAITNDPSGHYEIVGNEVVVKADQTIDFETAESHDITIEVTDAGGNTYSETITINVQDYEGSYTGTNSDNTVTGTSEEDTMMGDAAENNDLAGGAGDDYIEGGSLYDTIDGGDGNDQILGGSGHDTLDGGDGDDSIDGGQHGDHITGGAGNDTLDGGADYDYAHYSGNWSDYTITEDAGTYTIVDNRAGSPDGTDTITNFERVTFADGTVYAKELVDVGPSDIDISANSVDENSAAGIVVGTLSATDNALDSNSYVITNDSSELFEISGDQVVVKSGADIDFEDATSHDLTIEVTDGSGNTYSETVTINVNNLIDEGPTDITFTGGTVDETVADGGNIGSANDPSGTTVATLSTTDADSGDSFTYAITNDPSGHYEIIGNEVVVKADQTIDFETAESHDITIEVTDAGGNTYSETITINVQDYEGSYTGTNSDNTVTGTSEEDTLQGGDGNDVFVGSTGADSIDGGDGQDTLDYSASAEGVNVNLETAQGNDGDAEGDTYTSIENVVGSDFADIIKGNYEEGTTVHMGDGDDKFDNTQGYFDQHDTVYAEGGDDLVYTGDGNDTIVGGSGDDRIHGEGGTDTAVYSGDWSDYTITVNGSGYTIVDDRDGSPDGTDTVYTVENFEFADGTVSAADLVNTGPTDIITSDNSVDENSAVGTVVATLSAADADVLDSHTYTLTNDPSGNFEIVGNEVRVKAGSDLDLEDATSHDITIQVTDSSGETYSETITINVADVDEFDVGAITDTDGDGNTVSEGASNGDSVGITASATDLDGTNNTVTYSLSDDADGAYTIDENTGVVTVLDATKIDYEDATSQTIGVTASSSDGSSSTQSYSIAISDVNEGPSDIQLTGEAGNLVQNGSFETFDVSSGKWDEFTSDSSGAWETDTEMEVWDSYGGIEATDGDQFLELDRSGGVDNISQSIETNNGQVYNLSFDGQARVDNDSNSVEIYWNGELVDVVDPTHGEWSSFDFQVVGTGGEDVLEFREPSEDNNNLGAFIDNVSMVEVPFTIAEGVDGAVVGVLTTTDVDANDSHTYIVSDSRFEVVNDGDGNMQLKLQAGESFDYETETSVTLSVTTTDGSGETYSEDFTINIADMNDAPTDITFGANDDLDITSGTIASGSVVATVTGVVDENSDETFTYTLTDNADGKFAIDENTGNVTLVAEHDASAVFSDSVTVQATDSGGNTYSETVGINLGTDGADEMDGTSNTDIMYGFGAADTIDGGTADDVLVAGDSDAAGGTNLLVNGSFENDDVATDETFTSINGWTASSGGIELVDETYASYNSDASDGEQFAELDAQGENDGFYQDVQTTEGTVYNLSMDLADRTGHEDSSTIEVYWNGELLDSIDPTTTDWETYSFEVTGTGGSDRLEFREPDGESNNNGGFIDNVSLVSVTDILAGGDGDDTIYAGAGADSVDGGSGDDTVSYANSSSGVDVAFQDTDEFGVGGAEMVDTEAGGHGGDAEGDSFTSIENFIGTDYADNVYGGSSDMSFSLGDGNDVFDTDETGVTIDTIDAGSGDDQIWTGAGDDIITGGTGNDMINGEDGNDIITGGADNDTLYGGSGNDTFLFSEGDGADIINGGEGGGWTDTIQLSDAGGDLGDYGTDWTVSLTSGSIDSQDSNSLSLSDDADGIITLDDGSTINFLDIERIEF